MTSAVIVVDFQEDFVNPDGALYVKGAELVTPYINKLIADLSQRMPIIYTADKHSVHHKSFIKNGGIWPVHCVADSKGSELYSGLTIAQNASFLTKGQDDDDDGYSAFSGSIPVKSGDKTYQTDCSLETILRHIHADHLNICGVATDYCVNATVMDAIKLGYSVSVLENGIAAVDHQKEKEVLESWKNAGVSFMRVR